MAFEQYFAKEWKSIPSTAATLVEPENCNGCFDCNICLDYASEPVVTMCGHLYCWPCIYKWLHVQSGSLALDEPPQCPVCKAEISHTTMVPLYGRGKSSDEADLDEPKPSQWLTAVPPRPKPSGNQSPTSVSSQTGQQLPYRNPYRNQNINIDYPSSELIDIGGAGFQNPAIGMFGEMVYARVFGNSESLYAYSNPYRSGGLGSPRLRRQEIQADRSLSRVSIFLFCCFLLCLIVF